ncbi:MAG: hypothetical protein R3Y36_05960 [Spirochaetales bacterium]
MNDSQNTSSNNSTLNKILVIRTKIQDSFYVDIAVQTIASVLSRKIIESGKNY